MSNSYELTGWAKAKDPSIRDITLPSGQVCQIRNLKMEDIFVLGIVDDLDDFGTALMPKQPTRAAKRSGAAAKKAQEDAELKRIMSFLSDSQKFDTISGVLNKVVAKCVLQPALADLPEDGKDRDPEKIYVDQVDFMDRLEIFNQVFSGMGDMARFREGQE